MAQRQREVLFRGYVKKENAHWVAVCVDLNIVAQADSLDKAIEECGHLIIEYLEYICSVYPKQISKYIPRPAPQEFIDEFNQIVSQEFRPRTGRRNRRPYNFPVRPDEVNPCYA